MEHDRREHRARRRAHGSQAERREHRGPRPNDRTNVHTQQDQGDPQVDADAAQRVVDAGPGGKQPEIGGHGGQHDGEQHRAQGPGHPPVLLQPEREVDDGREGEEDRQGLGDHCCSARTAAA